MVAAQGRYWRVTLTRKRDAAQLALGGLPEDLQELGALRLEVPLGRWNAVLKHAESDRKLLGGILLDLAASKELIARVVASDRLLADLQRAMRDATMALVEAGLLVVAPASLDREEES